MARPQSKYKMSFYNVFHQDGDVQYLWNTYSNVLLKLDEDAQEYIHSFLGVDDGSDVFKRMKDNGFIVFEQLNEFGRICMEEKRELFVHNTNELRFTIAPGTGCNYSCRYCFESSSNRSCVMSLEIADDVAEYICNQIKNNPFVNRLAIEWFGGEPLLYLDSIEIISRKIMGYAQRNSIEYISSVLTNGRFLTAQTFTLLQELCVNNMNICIDGMCDLYCKSKDASPYDFDCVMDNTCHVAEKIKPTVRLNIPNNDPDEAIKITDYLLKHRLLKGKVRVFFAEVIDYSHPPNSSQHAEYVQSFSRWAPHLFKEYGISEIEHMSVKSRLIKCKLANTRSALIGPKGELYKCHRCPGVDSMIIGNIWEDRYFNDVEYAFYTTVDDPIKRKCSRCEYLPVCMGECQVIRQTNFDDFDCETRKTSLLRLRFLEECVFV